MTGQTFYSGKRLSLLLLVIYTLFSAGCSSSGSDTGNPAPGGDASLESYLKGQYAASALQWVSNGQGGAEGSADASGPVYIQANSADSASSRYSFTNLQESGVDESDTVKSDGTYLYVACDHSLIAARAVPRDTMEVVSSTEIDGTIDSLYLYQKIAVILYQPTGSTQPYPAYDAIALGCPSWIPAEARTGIALVDVSDPYCPVMIKDIVVDGTLVSSRSVGGMLRLILQFVPSLPPLESTYDGTSEDYDRKVAANLEILKDLTLDALAPSYCMTGSSGSKVEDQPLVSPEDFYIPENPCGGSIVSIISLDLNDPSAPLTSTGVVADAQAVYASPTALYITNSSFEGYFLEGNASCRTTVLKFDITGPKAVFKAKGTVPGYIISQLSLGEYDDILRIATATGFAWNSTARNNVFCLKEDSGSLEVIGTIENIAPGEQVYAVRFLGQRGYVVTFVKVDPLFTLDLSDPANPKIAGELKVPGYSTYLHPLDENHLLAIGKDAKAEGEMTWYQGLQLSVFDISTFSEPDLLFTEYIGDRGTESEALGNYKAFTYWSEKGLLAIPVYLCEHSGTPQYPYSYGTPTFAGLYVYRVSTQSGFTFLGRIGSEITEGNYYSPWSYGSWARGLLIDESVYAVDSSSVRSALTEDISATISTLNY